MDQSGFVLLGFAGLMLGSFWACLYTLGLYHFGRWLAPQFKEGRRRQAVFYVIGSAAGAPGLFLFLAPLGLWIQVSLAVLAWIWQFWAISSGFWSECDRIEGDRHRTLRSRTDDWLAEWEIPGGTPEDSERG